MVRLTIDPSKMSTPMPPRPKRTAVLVYDLSWSMDAYFEVSRRAIEEVVKDCLGDRNQVKVILFGSNAMHVDAGDEAAWHQMEPHFSRDSRSTMKNGTNFYAALSVVKDVVDALGPDHTVHIRYFTDGQHNTGSEEWPELFEREIRPKLASRTGSTMQVWFMGQERLITDDLRRISQQEVRVMRSDELMGETKLVAAQSLNRLLVETNLGTFMGVERPGCPIEMEKALPPGSDVPEHLQVCSMKVQAHNGLVSLLPDPGSLDAAPIERLSPTPGDHAVSFVLSMDSRDLSDIEYAIERLRSMSGDDERLADLRSAMEMLAACGSAHTPGSAPEEALQRIVNTTIAMQGRLQGRKLRRLRQAAHKLTAGQERVREATRRLPEQIGEAMRGLLRSSRQCEPFEDAITMDEVDAVDPGNFPVLVFDTPGAVMRRVVSEEGAFDPDQMPEDVTKAIMNAALSRMRPRVLCTASTMRALAEHSVTRVVGNDDFALPVLPLGHPAAGCLVRAVTSMAVCGVPGLSLGARCGDIFPQSLFQALALVGEADASDRVLPVACVAMLNYSMAYLSGTQVHSTPVVSWKEGPSFQACKPSLPASGVVRSIEKGNEYHFTQNYGHFRIAGTVTGGELINGERLGLVSKLIDSTGLPFGQKVSMMKYLQEILGDGSRDPVTMRDLEMGAGKLFESGQQAFGVTVAMLVHRRLAGESAASLKPVFRHAADSLVSSTLWDRLKPSKGGPARVPPATLFERQVVRIIESDPSWVSYAGREPDPSVIEDELVGALERSRQDVDGVLKRWCSLRHESQLPESLKLSDASWGELRKLVLEVLNRDVVWDNPLAVPYLGDSLARVLSAIACAQVFLELHTDVWASLKHGMPPDDLGLSDRVKHCLNRCEYLISPGGIRSCAVSSAYPVPDAIPFEFVDLALRKVFNKSGWCVGHGVPRRFLRKLSLSDTQKEIEKRRRRDMVASLTTAVVQSHRRLIPSLTTLRACSEGWCGEQPLRKEILDHVGDDPEMLCSIFKGLPKTLFEGSEALLGWFNQACKGRLSEADVEEKRGKPGDTPAVPGARKFNERTRSYVKTVQGEILPAPPEDEEIRAITSLDLLRFVHRTGNTKVARRLFWILKHVPNDHMVVKHDGSTGNWRVVEISGLRPSCWHTLFHRIRCCSIGDQNAEGSEKFESLHRDVSRQRSYFASDDERPPGRSVRDPRTGQEVRDFRSTLESVLEGRPVPEETAHLASKWTGE